MDVKKLHGDGRKIDPKYLYKYYDNKIETTLIQICSLKRVYRT